LSNLNVNGLSNLIRIDCSFNLLTSLDVSDRAYLDYLKCSNNQLTTLNINFGNLYNTVQITPWATRTYLAEILFDNNPNIKYVCANDGYTTLVQNLITNYGYTNCHVNSYCSFTPGGIFYTIQGNNKIDQNLDGCDASDLSYSNLKFTISHGTNLGSIICNTSGSYSIPVQTGSYTITPQFENPSYFSSSPTSATVSFPTTTSPYVQNFCVQPNGIHHDLEVVIIPLGVSHPGFDAIYKIKYKNKGNQNENTTINFNYNDAFLDYVSSTLAPASTGIGSLTWNLGTIMPFQNGEFLVTLNVNSSMETPAVNSGDILNYTAEINGLNSDETPIDNTFSLHQIVVNSNDPNEKTCLEGTTISPNMIGEYVHYQIRFENTGTFPAQNVVIKDLIDTSKFDVSTLQITDASHSCFSRITDTNKVEFIFENINLPFDNATNNGYVAFKIKTKPTLIVGDNISNLANIYFDYNFPFVTNSATSTFQTLTNTKFNFDNYLILSPNPVKEILNINFKGISNVKSISIYNMYGQLVQTATNPSNSVDVTNLKTGNYIIKLITNEGEINRKFLKK
jgi:hypothetical protein